eukprot:scaffold18517_cov129-Isochrysis_galbana.AAC.1
MSTIAPRGLSVTGRRLMPSVANHYPRARSVTVDQASGNLRLMWCDGEARTFNPLWLRDNCSATRHKSSRQKLVSAASLPAELRPAVAEIKTEDDVLRVVWEPDLHESAYSAAWLRSFSDDIPAEVPAPSLRVVPPLMRFSVGDLEAGDDTLRWSWLSELHEHGAVLVHDAPCEKKTVMQVAQWIGPVQNQIYGEAWDVVSSENAINIAYTGEYLGPHMDLCYYESPPGVQLLHCMEFPAEITGGESLLIDAFAVANALRKSDPQAFADLSRIPATFVKDHSDRAEPVRLQSTCPS